MFLFLSEKTEWQKERATLMEVKDKLEEQKQVDAVKIQEFNVSQMSTCFWLSTVFNAAGCTARTERF